MSQPFKLFRLQQIDSLLDQARARVNEIERILRDDKQVKAAVAESNRTDQVLKETRKILQQAEEEVKAQQIKIEHSEAALYGGKVRNPKELQDLQQEAASLKKYLAVLEDRLLESMMVVEEAEEENNLALKKLEEMQARSEVQNKALIEERSQLQKDLERFSNEREAAVSTIESHDLDLYDQLRQQRRGIAVARVADNTCAACGSTLTPSIVQSAHSPSQIARCTFCGRILYAG